MSGKKRKRRPRPAALPVREPEAAPPAEIEARPEPRARREGLFGGVLFGSGGSVLPPVTRSIGRGVLAVVVQPALVVATLVVVFLAWLVLVALGFEGTPNRMVATVAMPPISTYFDLGTGASLLGVGTGFLVFTGLAILIRTVLYSALAGVIVEALEDGRVSLYGILSGVRAVPTVLIVQALSFSLIIGGNLVFPVLGPGIGFLGFVAALVAGLFFLGFAPTAAVREGRTALETIRRSGRAAMLPGGRHLLLCVLYFFLALPVVVGFSPGGTDITANPTLVTWLFVFVVNILHVGFMAAFAYRWIVAEPAVPEEPVRRRARAPAPRTRARR
ncbi:MAG TPA: hypothetical protein VF029_00730 [Actinomycetota bacterium]